MTDDEMRAALDELGESISRLDQRVDYLSRVVAHMPGFGAALDRLDRADQEGETPPVTYCPLHLVRGGADAS